MFPSSLRKCVLRGITYQ